MGDVVKCRTTALLIGEYSYYTVVVVIPCSFKQHKLLHCCISHTVLLVATLDVRVLRKSYRAPCSNTSC